MKNHLIAICSGTKGCGKTWLGVNVSHCLSLLKKKVLFFDADCSIENAFYQLGISFEHNYNSLLSGLTTLNNATIKYNKNLFDIIGTKSGENSLFSAPIGRVQVLAHDLLCFSKNYDYVIIDCSDDDVKNVNSFINICNTILLIVDADFTSIENAYKKIEKLKKINCKANIKLVINRAMSYNEGNQIFESLHKASINYIDMDLSLLSVIRQDTRIRDSVLNKSLLLNRYPTSEGAEDLMKLSQKILEDF